MDVNYKITVMDRFRDMGIVEPEIHYTVELLTQDRVDEVLHGKTLILRNTTTKISLDGGVVIYDPFDDPVRTYQMDSRYFREALDKLIANEYYKYLSNLSDDKFKYFIDNDMEFHRAYPPKVWMAVTNMRVYGCSSCGDDHIIEMEAGGSSFVCPTTDEKVIIIRGA